MTGVVEGISAANGIASLFNTTITWFNYIQVSKEASSSLQSLLVKLDSAQVRLSRWGEAVGLTGSDVEDDDTMRSAGTFQLTADQEQQAIQTFLTVAVLFDECQKLCINERKKKAAENPGGGKIEEVKPFDAAAASWNPMHQYLHKKMRDIVEGRKNKVKIGERLLFAIYKKDHLEKFVKDINDHIDALYKIYSPEPKVQSELGKAEMTKLLQIVQELGMAAERDKVIHSAVSNIIDFKNNTMTFNTENSTIQSQGPATGNTFTMTVNPR